MTTIDLFEITEPSKKFNFEAYCKNRYTEDLRHNIDTRALMKTGVKNFVEKHPWHTEEEILTKIAADELFAELFVTDPVTQNCFERYALDYINNSVSNIECDHPSVDGKNALYVYKGEVVKQDKIPESEQKAIKSIDFKIIVHRPDLPDLTIFASHKHTDKPGGNQNHQWDDLETFAKNAFKSTLNNVLFVALCDGKYYQNQKVKDKLTGIKFTRLEQLNKLYKSDTFVAMTTDELLATFGISD